MDLETTEKVNGTELVEVVQNENVSRTKKGENGNQEEDEIENLGQTDLQNDSLQKIANNNANCENGRLSDGESTSEKENDKNSDQTIDCDINEEKTGSVLESMLTSQNEGNDDEEDDFNPLLLCPDISMDVDESPMVTSEASMANDLLDPNSLFTPLFSTFVDEMTGAEISFNLSAEEQQIREKMYGPDNPIECCKIHCTACNVHLGSALGGQTNRFVHPLLKVLICKECYHFYTSGEFEKDEDGSELYCRWCGQGGQVLCCSKCEFVFCKKCIRINFGRKKLTMIRDSDEWSCFRCDMSQLKLLRAMCVEFFEYVKRETGRAALEKDPDFVNRDRTNCCQTQQKKRGGGGGAVAAAAGVETPTDSDGDKERTIKRQKRKRYSEVDEDPDYNPFREREEEAAGAGETASRPSSPVPSTSGLNNSGVADDKKKRRRRGDNDPDYDPFNKGGGGEQQEAEGEKSKQLPPLLPKPSGTPYRPGGMSTVRIGDTLVNVKTIPTMPALRTFTTAHQQQQQQPQQQSQQQQRPISVRQIGPTVRLPMTRPKTSFTGTVRTVPSATVPQSRMSTTPTTVNNNNVRTPSSSSSSSNTGGAPTMKHEWFEKTVRAAARVNSNLSYTLTQLNKAQASASSVEQLAVVHNKLQEILSSSINSLIQIRKNLRTEFISGIKTIRFPPKQQQQQQQQTAIDPNDDDVILVTPPPNVPPDVSTKNKAILAGLPQISLKKSTPTKISNNNNLNGSNKTGVMPMAVAPSNASSSSSSPPARGYLKVRSFSQLQTVTSECITIPDDDPVTVEEETSDDPLAVEDSGEESTVVVEIDLKNNKEKKSEDKEEGNENVEKEKEKEITNETEEKSEKETMEKDKNEDDKEKNKEVDEDATNKDDEKENSDIEQQANKDEEEGKKDEEEEAKDKDEGEKNEEEIEKDNEEAKIDEEDGKNDEEEVEKEENGNESEKKIEDEPSVENGDKVKENSDTNEGEEDSNDSASKVNGAEGESEVITVKKEREEGDSYNVKEKPSPKIRRMLSVKVNLKKSVVVEDYVKKEPLENGE